VGENEEAGIAFYLHPFLKMKWWKWNKVSWKKWKKNKASNKVHPYFNGEQVSQVFFLIGKRLPFCWKFLILLKSFCEFPRVRKKTLPYQHNQWDKVLKERQSACVLVPEKDGMCTLDRERERVRVCMWGCVLGWKCSFEYVTLIFVCLFVLVCVVLGKDGEPWKVRQCKRSFWKKRLMSKVQKVRSFDWIF
jgi:hypothetical protein